MSRLDSWFVVVLPVFLAAGCGPPTTPEGFPLVTGVYTAFWSSDFTSVPGGVKTTGGPCGLTLRITTQTANTFEGSALRGHPCVRADQVVRGTVERDGRLTFDLVGTTGFQGFDDCRHVAGDARWRGRRHGDELEGTIDVLLECPGLGQLQTRSTIEGRVVPDARP
jgi:hypothetical protein